jgi:hypothetical protein
VNNIFHGPGAPPSGSTAFPNWTDAQGDPALVDPTAQNYLLMAGSPCIDAGVDPGSGSGQALEPAAEYAATASGITRTNTHWDLGAFAFGDVGPPVDAGVGVTSSTGTSATSSGAATVSSSASGIGASGTSSGGASHTTAASSGSSHGTSVTGSSGTGSSGSTGNSVVFPTGTGGNSSTPSKGGCGCGDAPASETALGWTLLFGLALSARRRPPGR